MRAFSCAAVLGVLAACGSNSKDHGELVAIEIEPANATLAYTGTPTSIEYTALGRFADGSTEPLDDVTFRLDLDATKLGALEDTTFTASGNAAGKGGVFAERGDLTGSTSVIVTVHTTDLGPGVPADGADRFPDTSPAGAMSQTIVYPLDGAVMPSSVKAPDVQWEGPTAGEDLYRVRLTAGFATVDKIVAGGPDFTFHALPTEAEWALLKTSAGNGTIQISVDHWDATNGPHGGAPVDVKMVPADITGAIYYWNLEAGRMERIDAMGRAPAIANPPAPPSNPNNRCVACHTVSRDGRYLSAELWGGGAEGAVFDLADPNVRTGDPAPTVAPLIEGSTYRALFSTFNPDASRLLINNGTRLELIDPRSGAPVLTSGTALPISGAAHPSWSPDGSTIAFVRNVMNGAAPATWAVDYTRGDLGLIPVTGPDSFGDAVTIVDSANVDPAFVAPSWPTWAPDSQWIAYGAGVNSRGRNDGIPAVYPGSLFIVNKAGGPPIRLDIACGNVRDCHLPNFSPYDAGGYFWLVFYSTRDYGNALAGTKGRQRRQLWVTAIDKAKLAAGEDASSVAYWLPDQDVQAQNMSAYWAPPAPIQ